MDVSNIMQTVFITLATLEMRSRPHDQMDKSNIMQTVFVTLKSFSTHATCNTGVNAGPAGGVSSARLCTTALGNHFCGRAGRGSRPRQERTQRGQREAGENWIGPILACHSLLFSYQGENSAKESLFGAVGGPAGTIPRYKTRSRPESSQAN